MNFYIIIVIIFIINRIVLNVLNNCELFPLLSLFQRLIEIKIDEYRKGIRRIYNFVSY